MSKDKKSDNDIHPLQTPYSTAGAQIDDGAPSLNQKRSHEMKAYIDVVKEEIVEDVSGHNQQSES